MIDLRSTDSKLFTVEQFRGRLRWVLLALSAAGIALLVRAADLQLFDDGFLLKQGDARYARVAKLAAHRGAIYDRNGETLAISTPVDSVWINPSQLNQAADQIPKLAEALQAMWQRAGAKSQQQPGSRFCLPAAAHESKRRRAGQGVEHSRCVSATRISSLLSGG